MNVHNLKIKPNYFKDVIAEVKKFEIRFNDRGFEVGDLIVLADEENIGANESDPVGSYCVCFDFMHKGKCYRYYDQG